MKRMMKLYLTHLSILLIVSIYPQMVSAKTIYIEPSLTTACPSDYNQATRSCSGGTDAAHPSLSSAFDVVSPGDVLLLRAGTYGQLAPSKSGSQDKPIVIKNYSGEIARITNLSDKVALSITNHTDLVIEGLQVDNVLGFGRIENSMRIVIKNMTFSNALSTGTTGGLKLVRSSHNLIMGNKFIDGNDNVVLQDSSDQNIIEENIFIRGRHSLLSIRCSSYNVFRKNTFSNPIQKAVEIYDCEGTSDGPYRLDATKRNLFENNTFTETLASDSDHRYNAIQHGAQHTIVRRNVFRNCKGGGVNYQSYADESLYVYSNRLYNNTFYNNGCYGIIGDTGTVGRYYDNRAMNNLLYKNTSCSSANEQVRIPDPQTVILSNNTLATSDPKFVNEMDNDFHLAASSPSVDSGVFLSTASNSGSGSTFAVTDAGYFYDGFGIEGEVGDTIQLEGQLTGARIVSINYGNNLIILDKPLIWTKGQGVSLIYAGNAPDIGAFEYGLPVLVAPSPPINLRIEP